MTKREYKMYYDYKKRTRGGIIDAIFLGSIIIIIATFIFLYVMGGIWYGFNIR